MTKRKRVHINVHNCIVKFKRHSTLVVALYRYCRMMFLVHLCIHVFIYPCDVSAYMGTPISIVGFHIVWHIVSLLNNHGRLRKMITDFAPTVCIICIKYGFSQNKKSHHKYKVFQRLSPDEMKIIISENTVGTLKLVHDRQMINNWIELISSILAQRLT